MSLSNAINIGRSGLLSAQTGLQTVGNNLANQATEGYRRQQVSLSPVGSQDMGTGNFVGRGVQVQAIERQIDEALEARLRNAQADVSGSQTMAGLLGQVESIHNAYGDNDLSSRLNAMFDAFSELANNPQDSNKRTLVVEQATALAQEVQAQWGDLRTLGKQVDGQIDQAVNGVNDLLGEVEQLNKQIAINETGSGADNGLRDKRDGVLSELGGLIDISTRESDNGQVDVFVGSTPLVLDGRSRGVTLDGDRLRVASDNSPMELSSGKLGALVQFRDQELAGVMQGLNGFAHELAWQVNRVHSQGQGLQGQSEWTSGATVEDADAALNSDEAGLAFELGHGSFQVQLTNTNTGQRTSHTINVNLEASDPNQRTTLNDVAGQIDAIAGLSASVSDSGRLKIEAGGSDHAVGFGEDSSGLMAAMGLNTFFAGTGARDLAVAGRIAQNGQRIAAAQGPEAGDNSNAIAIAELRDRQVDRLGGKSLSASWREHIETLASTTAQAKQRSEATEAVRDNLKSHQQARSGVNVDEEAIDLMRFQSSYQANARFLSVVDEMMKTLIAMT